MSAGHIRLRIREEKFGADPPLVGSLYSSFLMRQNPDTVTSNRSFPSYRAVLIKDLRIQSAEFVASKEADGNAIGGLAVGEPAEVMYEMIEVVNGILPKDKPRYLMGVARR